MNKSEFLSALGALLSELPKADAQRSLEFYGEMIDDRTEDGLTEEEAVAAIGTPEEIAAQIRGENTVVKTVQDVANKRRSLRWWELLLLILGSPLWISLLTAAAAILIALYIVIWSGAISMYATEVALIVTSLVGIAFSVVLFVQGNIGAGIALLGVSLLLAGFCIAFFLACHYTGKALWNGTLWIGRKIRSAFRKKETKV